MLAQMLRRNVICFYIGGVECASTNAQEECDMLLYRRCGVC